MYTQLAADYNDLLRQLSSPKITVIGCYTIGDTIGEVRHTKWLLRGKID